MVLAYHIIFTAYGFWLPNDPRGSWSDFVWSWELARFGAATTVGTRKSVAGESHDRIARETPKQTLLHEPVRFGEDQVGIIARGFDDARTDGGYRILACAILPEHVHMVIGRHATRDIEMIGSHLKARASLFLANEKMHPFQDEVGRRNKRPSMWSESFWQVYLDSRQDIERAMPYVEQNPVKEGRGKQRWWFVENELETPRPKGRG